MPAAETPTRVRAAGLCKDGGGPAGDAPAAEPEAQSPAAMAEQWLFALTHFGEAASGDRPVPV